MTVPAESQPIASEIAPMMEAMYRTYGFVLWRIADGKVVERWPTFTPLHELAAQTLEW